MEDHESTHTFTVNELVTYIFAVLAIIVILAYYVGVASGARDINSEATCKQLGQARGYIHDWAVIGPYLVEADLLDLPPGCGKMYKKPCAPETDCREKIRSMIDSCWDFIQSDPKTTGMCLTELRINESISGTALNKNTVCGTTGSCTNTEAPIDNIIYDSVPQGNSSIAMEYGDNKINVKCMGKCRYPP